MDDFESIKYSLEIDKELRNRVAEWLQHKTCEDMIDDWLEEYHPAHAYDDIPSIPAGAGWKEISRDYYRLKLSYSADGSMHTLTVNALVNGSWDMPAWEGLEFVTC